MNNELEQRLVKLERSNKIYAAIIGLGALAALIGWTRSDDGVISGHSIILTPANEDNKSAIILGFREDGKGTVVISAPESKTYLNSEQVSIIQSNGAELNAYAELMLFSFGKKIGAVSITGPTSTQEGQISVGNKATSLCQISPDIGFISSKNIKGTNAVTLYGPVGPVPVPPPTIKKK